MLIKNLPFTLLKPNDWTFKRYSTGSYVKGKWVKGNPTDLPVKALIYPVIKQHKLTFLPEALRSKKTLQIFTNNLLYQFQDGDQKQQADEFEFSGEKYRVMYVGDWEAVSGYYAYEAYACKIDSQVLELSGG